MYQIRTYDSLSIYTKPSSSDLVKLTIRAAQNVWFISGDDIEFKKNCHNIYNTKIVFVANK